MTNPLLRQGHPVLHQHTISFHYPWIETRTNNILTLLFVFLIITTSEITAVELNGFRVQFRVKIVTLIEQNPLYSHSHSEIHPKTLIATTF